MNPLNASSKTDPLEVPIYVRAYSEEIDREKEAKAANDNGAVSPKIGADQNRLANPERFTLMFDTETTTDASQRFKVGFYQLYDGDRLDEERLFVDPSALSPTELCIVQEYVEARRLKPPMLLAEFRRDVILARGYELGATIVTFNGPFDLARIATGWSPARASKYRRKMQGGFSLAMSNDPYQPAIQIKNLNSHASLVEFTAPRKQATSRSRRKRNEKTPTNRGWFVDVKSLAKAITARSHSLASLTETLKTKTRKEDRDDHGQEVTFDYLDYARSDVQATWECFEILRAKYRSYGLNAELHSIISEASIGKAVLDTMGLKPLMRASAGPVDGGLTSKLMQTYVGGRTEVRIRRKKVRVIHTDFMSMYPTVCTLQGLWRFVIGDGFTHVDATRDIRAFVEAATPDLFQQKSSWLKLPAIVRITPDHDLLPVRAAYGQAAAQSHGRKKQPSSPTIGLNYLTYDGDLWITLADCLAAKFLSGKVPVIEEAIVFTPGPPQPNLKPVKLLGRHLIDPHTHDLFRELIRARQLEEANKAGKSEDEEIEIEEIREALKITANSTSYGIYVQVNVNKAGKKTSARVFRPDGSWFERRVEKVETPGPWFNPLVATLITGAARLMLALAEHQALEQGLDWAFCDTDSLAIAQPDGMPDDEFVCRSLAVVEWFQPLNPYGFDEPILKVEKINYAVNDPTRLEPLYCWAISSKRYALFNIHKDNWPVIRKASAHGLGHLLSPYSKDDPPTCFPEPLPKVLSGKEKLQRWHYDAWCAILDAVLCGNPNDVRWDYHPALNGPTVSRYGATTPDLLGWMGNLNEGKPYEEMVKPFGFLLTLHPSKFARSPDDQADVFGDQVSEGEMHPVAPFDKDLKQAVARAFDRIAGKPTNAATLETYREVLAGYPNRPEAKFLNGEPFDEGATSRRHIIASGVELMGKEADRWEETYFLGLSGNGSVEYGTDPTFGPGLNLALKTAAELHGDEPVADATGLRRLTVAKLRRGSPVSVQVSEEQIADGLRRLADEYRKENKAREDETARLSDLVSKAGGIRAGARLAGMDPSNLSKRLLGQTANRSRGRSR